MKWKDEASHSHPSLRAMYPAGVAGSPLAECTRRCNFLLPLVLLCSLELPAAGAPKHLPHPHSP